MPSINLYHITKTDFYSDDLRKGKSQTITGYHFRIGDYQLSYIYESYGKSFFCRLNFTLRDDSKNMCFLITQVLSFNNKKEMFQMKLVKKDKDNKTYTYECKIISDEINELIDCTNKTFDLETEVVIFYAV